MLFKRPKEEEPILGITPLIDIVFLLLIFFMMTSHFNVVSGVPIRLPKVVQKGYDRESRRIIVVIDREGRTYLKGERMDLKELGPKLQDLVEKDDLVHMILEADKEVRHGRVVQVMDIARRAGVSSIIIAARWGEEEVL